MTVRCLLQHLNVLYLNMKPILLQIRSGLFSSINVLQIPTSNLSMVREGFFVVSDPCKIQENLLAVTALKRF